MVHIIPVCELRWLVDGRVLWVRLDGSLSVALLTSTMNRIVSLIDASPGEVDYIVEIGADAHFEVPVFKLVSLLRPLLLHSKSGWQLVVTQSSAGRVVGQAVSTVTGVRFSIFGTHDDAADFLRRMDNTIEDKIDFNRAHLIEP